MNTKNVVLAGFMGTGKTTVSRLLARSLGRAFIDMDGELETRFGKPVAAIFADEGEPAFRRAERALARELAARENAVIAAGGGAILDDATLRAFLDTGEVVCLTARPETLVSRLKSGRRPLLDAGAAGPGDGDRMQRVQSLLGSRDSAYRRIPFHLATDGLSPQDLANRVAALLDPWPERIEVRSGAQRYTIEVTPGLSGALAPRLAPWMRGTAAVITDARVRRLHAACVTRALDELKVRHDVFAIPPGEPSKTWNVAGTLHRRLLRARVDRKTLVIALGGGVVGDLAGFVAATHKRGLPIVHVPTTLVAQLDSAIGGKNGVNLPEAKNQLGTIHSPAAVFADPRLLATLDARELRNGLAEAVKTAVIGSRELFELLEETAGGNYDETALARIVRLAAAVKARIVTRDPLESGERRVLNLGHTIGHALEASGGYGGMSHGEAVSIGMVAETRLACRLGLASQAVETRIRRLLERIGLPVEAPRRGRAALLKAMVHDKKAEGGLIHVALPRRIGRVDIVPLAPDEVARILDE